MSEDSKKDKDIARKIWLAGIGAYGRAFNDAQEAYSKVGKETAKLFDDLVGKGEDLENKVSEAAKKIVPEIAEKQKTTIETRMERMKTALGLADVAGDQNERMDTLEERLDAIEGKLDQILAAVKPAPKARRTTKTSTSTKRKTTSKKTS